MSYDSRAVDAVQPYQAWPKDLDGERIWEHRLHNIAAPTDPTDHVRMLAGKILETWDGRMFRYVQMTGGDASLGMILEAAADVVVANDIQVATSTASLLTTLQAWTAGDFDGDWVYVHGGVGAGQTRRILKNNVTQLHLDRPLTTVLDATSDITIIRPFKVAASAGNLVDRIMGVAAVINESSDDTNAIDEDSFGFVQVEGFCEAVTMEAAVTVGLFVGPSTTAGEAFDVAATNDFSDNHVFAYAMGVGGTSVNAPCVLFNII